MVSREATRFSQEVCVMSEVNRTPQDDSEVLARATRRMYSSWHLLTWGVQFGGKTKCSQLGHIQCRCLLDIARVGFKQEAAVEI